MNDEAPTFEEPEIEEYVEVVEETVTISAVEGSSSHKGQKLKNYSLEFKVSCLDLWRSMGKNVSVSKFSTDFGSVSVQCTDVELY